MNNKKPLALDLTLTIANMVAVFIAFTYVCGYLINSTFTATLGLNTRTFLKAEYIEAGLFFELVSMAIIAIPVILWFFLQSLQSEGDISSVAVSGSSPDAQDIYRGRHMILPFCLVANLCYVMLFFAIFITKEYFHLQINLDGYIFGPGNYTISFGYVFGGYFFTAISLFLILGMIRWLIRTVIRPALIGAGDSATRALLMILKLLKIVRSVCLVSLVIISVAADLILIVNVSLLRYICVPVFLYLGLLFLLLLVVSYTIFRLRQMTNPLTRWLMIALASFFSCTLLFFAILLYGVLLYPNIPENRGGKYPLTQVTFVIKDKLKSQYKDLIDPKFSAEGRTVPLFLLDRDDKLLFTARVRGPFQEWVRDVHVIKRDEIARMDITRNASLKDYAID